MEFCSKDPLYQRMQRFEIIYANFKKNWGSRQHFVPKKPFTLLARYLSSKIQIFIFLFLLPLYIVHNGPRHQASLKLAEAQ